MTKEELAKEQELHALVQRIVAEEEAFKVRSNEIRGDDLELEERHQLLVDHLGPNGEHCRLRSAHEAMFKVHRKIAREHQSLISHCLTLTRRLKGSFLTERELTAELARLRLMFQRIKDDHERIEGERQKILSEHEAILREEKPHG